MPRPKKYQPAQIAALKTAEIQKAAQAEQDIVYIPGFAAETVSFSRSVNGVVFADCKGRQVIVKLTDHGRDQFLRMNREA